jgi:hypothetical protein
MPGRVLVLRVIATPDVTAGHAHAQVNPFITRFQAFLAAGSVSMDWFNHVSVGALFFLCWVQVAHRFAYSYEYRLKVGF